MPQTNLEIVPALVKKGYSVAVTPPFTMYHPSAAPNFSTSWENIAPKPGNICVTRRGTVALIASSTKCFTPAIEALRQMSGGESQQISLGKSLTCVFTYKPVSERIVEGIIPGGTLLGVQIVFTWHVPPTEIFQDGIQHATYVVDVEPTPLPKLLISELSRYGFYRSDDVAAA